MRALVQRVSEASVMVAGTEKGRIDQGLLVLLGVSRNDTEKQARFVADKCVNLRLFEDNEGRFNLSALQTGADILVVSQFTLYGETRKGRRPSFTEAAPPDLSEPLYEQFVSYVRESGLRTETGVFGAMMQVHLINDGPVTVMVEKED